VTDLEKLAKLMKILHETGFSTFSILDRAYTLVAPYVYRQLVNERNDGDAPFSEIDQALRQSEIVQDLARRAGIHVVDQLNASAYEQSNVAGQGQT
jgi:hypothetical protein